MKGEIWKSDVSICDTWCNGFGDSWGEGQGTIAVGREDPILGRESACLFSGIPAWPGTHWKDKMALFESEEKRNQTF